VVSVERRVAAAERALEVLPAAAAVLQRALDAAGRAAERDLALETPVFLAARDLTADERAFLLTARARLHHRTPHAYCIKRKRQRQPILDYRA